MVAAVDLGYGAVLRKASKYLSRINDGFNVKDIIEFTRIVNSSPTKRNEWKKRKFCLKLIDTSTSHWYLKMNQKMLLYSR